MKKKFVVVALLSMIATPALAADTSLYAAGALGMTSSVSDTDSGMSFSGLVGYQVNPSWAVEGGYTSLMSGANVTTGVAGVTGKTSVSGIEFAGVYNHPINEQISVLARLGYASMAIKVEVTGPGGTASSSMDGSGILLGLAGQYKVNEQLGVRVGFNRYTLTDASGTGEKPNNFFAAAVYKF